ncbi:hypothetical protein PLICRDRAFT_94363, partial [Plicaturopsis crispa FD-325 SS-3]
MSTAVLARQILARRLPTVNATAALTSFQATRRTFLTATRLCYPSAKPAVAARISKTAARKTTSKAKKPAAKKTTKAKPATKPKKKPVKRVVAKKVAKPKKKAAPKKSTLVRLTKEERIPSRGPSAWTLFWSRYVKSLPEGNSKLADHAQSVSNMWKDLSPAEKEVFEEEAASLRVKQKEERLQYMQTVKPEVLREVNRRRVKNGLKRLARARGPEGKRPVTGFVRYIMELRESPAAESIRDGSGDKRLFNRQVFKQGAAQWREMTPEQKAPYNKEFQYELVKWKARKAEAEAAAA